MRRTHTLITWLTLASLAPLTACDEILPRSGGVSSSTPRQQRALRALITPRGVQTLLLDELSRSDLSLIHI